MKVRLFLVFVVALLLAACGDAAPTAAPATAPTAPAPAAANGAQPEHITLQHILIGFKTGSTVTVPGKPITRTQDEAKALAYKLLAQAQGGADFDQLVKDNTDDAPPGIYALSNTGVPPAQGEYPRENMVPAFGNVGFALQVGQIGIADYDPQTSPYGYHIIKRLK